MKFQKLWLFWQVFDDEVLRNISQQFISLVYGNAFSLTPTGVILKNFMNFSFNFCEIWGNLTQDLRLKNHPRSSGLKKRGSCMGISYWVRWACIVVDEKKYKQEKEVENKSIKNKTQKTKAVRKVPSWMEDVKKLIDSISENNPSWPLPKNTSSSNSHHQNSKPISPLTKRYHSPLLQLQ